MRGLRRSAALALALLAPASGLAGDATTRVVSPRAQLPNGSGASEYWDLAAHFDGGQRLYARFLITNEGPGVRNGLAFGHVIFADGRIVPFQNGRRESRWSLAADGRRLEIGASRLALAETGERRLDVVKKKQGIRVQLAWEHAVGDTALPVEVSAGYRIDLLDLATPIRGTLWVAGMETAQSVTGRAALTHTWSQATERRVIARRIDVVTFDAAHALYLTDLTTPSGERRQALVYTEAGGAALRSHGAVAGPAGPAVGFDPDELPPSLRISVPAATGETSLGEPWLRHDPLDALPVALRMMYFFGTRPERVWADARVELRFSEGAPGTPAPLRVDGVAVLTTLDTPAAP